MLHDLGSKWPEVRLCREVRTQDVIEFLEDLIAKWGFPETITTDNGPQFRSYEFEHWLQERGIGHVLTPLYHPQANCRVERFNQILKQGLKTGLVEGRSVGNALKSKLFHYRSTVHSVAGMSPAEIMLGRKLRQPLSQMVPKGSRQETLPRKPSKLIDSVTATQASMKRYIDQKRRGTSSSFAPGSWVRLKRPLKGHKLKSQLSEPLEVWSKIGYDTYLLQDGQRWHADRLVAIEAPKGAVNTSALSGAAEVSLDGDTFLDMSEDGDYGEEKAAVAEADEGSGTGNRVSGRIRSRPKWLDDYEMDYAA